jgi:hypothetical protein
MKNLTTETRRHGEESGDQNGNLPLRSFFGVVLAVLREIFDESAYERFLSRTGSLRSSASYREFLREREIVMATKPRCC